MAADVFELALIGNVSEQFVETILHFESSKSASTTPDQDALYCVQMFESSLEGEWLGMLASDYRLGGYRSRRVNNTGGPSYSEPRTASTGTIGSQSVVSGAGVLITMPYYNTGGTPPKWRTGLVYVPGLPEGQVVENVIGSVMITAVNAYISALATTLIAGGITFVPGVWSRAQGVFYQPVAFDLSIHIGTQRRRYKPVL